jgi:lysophospholipase L1-like esterase
MNTKRRTIASTLLALAAFFMLVLPAWACPDIDGLVDINCDRQLTIVAFGDSITHGVGDNYGLGGYPGRLASSYPNAFIVNAGNPGEQTTSGKVRAASVFATYPYVDYAIVLEGVNDYWGLRSVSSTVHNVRSIAGYASAYGGISLISTLTAVRRSYQQSWVRDVNNSLRAYTSIDFYALGQGIISSDLLHPNGYGYDQMATVARSSLSLNSEANRPADTDGDGLYDYKEVELGSDIFDKDSDGDGLLDGEDYGSGGSPVLTDSDFDGISDYDEVKIYGSNPGDARPGIPTISSLDYVTN